MKTPEEIEKAEKQIAETQKDYRYRLADYSIGELMRKFVSKGQQAVIKDDDSIANLYVPVYQRDFVWAKKMQSKFIESVFMNVPIQPLFAFQLDEDGNLELLDGVQRLSSIKSFVDNSLTLEELEELDTLNGFTFNDLNTARKRKFLSTELKLYIINENTDEGIRADIFRRVNESGTRLNPAEIRKGKFVDNSFYSFILEMTKSEEFEKLFSTARESDKLRGEKEELLSRFFALSNNYQNFVHSVKGFLDEYIIETGKTFDNTKEEQMKNELIRTLRFVETHFPYGFRKSENSKSIPRVRFEAIAVGTNLALREVPDLTVKNINWLNSDEFKNQTTSDAANNKSKVVGRIEFVKKCLLGNPNIELTYEN